MFSMSFKIAPENGPCTLCSGHVVPQASRRVVWGVLSNLTIPLHRPLQWRLPFPSRQQSTVWAISFPTQVSPYVKVQSWVFFFQTSTLHNCAHNIYSVSKKHHPEKVWIWLSSANSWGRVIMLFLPPHSQEGCVVVRNHSKTGTAEWLTLFLTFP